MRSKLVALVFCVLLFPAFGTAQEGARSRVVVPLAEGGFVAFKSDTAGATNAAAAVQEPRAEFRSQAFTDEGGVIHRLLLDAAGKFVFGYDLSIQTVAASRTFNVAVKPLNSQIENKLLKSSVGGQTARIATLLQSSDPQILDDGDSFTLDLLVNEKTGVKIVDFVRVSFDRSNLENENPRKLPRDFTPDAVALTVKDYRLLIDGKLVAAGKPGTNFAGPLIWCYVEGHGRFIFSLVPRDGYQFQKVGIINENRIEFTLKDNHYEWLSDSPILPGGGTWNVWVLHDPKYVPFGMQEIVKREKGKLDKLDDSIKAVENKAAKIRDSAPAALNSKIEEVRPAQAAKRFKVMVGAADRIENLWPRNR